MDCMKKVYEALFVLLMFTFPVYSQSDSLASGNTEIYLIDSYITLETPHKMVVSFFTSDSVTSKIYLFRQNEIQVTKELTNNHKVEINLDTFINIVSPIKYWIIVKDRNENESKSQLYEVEMPQGLLIESERDLGMLRVCCLGGIIFGLPSPTFISMGGKEFFSLTKEIPLFSFYSSGYNYPWGYFGIEYAHIFNSGKRNFIRTGYKQIFQLDFIKYISPGINFFADFKGYNGISPELSVGLFQLRNVFTFFARYRYNFQPGRSNTDFHEASVGLYSNFFSINF